jgi:hypothetical protein
MASKNFGSDIQTPIARQCIAAGTITRHNLVIINGRSANTLFPTVIRASSAAAATTYGKLGIALNSAVTGDKVDVVDWIHLVDIDTSGYGAINDPVYLGVAGAVSATPGTIAFTVGRITSVHATTGSMYLDDRALGGLAGFDYTGTDYISWTINRDGAAAAADNPILNLIGGDGGADLIRTSLTQDSVLETLTYSQRNGAVYISPSLNVGRAAETTAFLNSTLVLTGTTATPVVRSLTALVNGAGNAISILGNALATPVAAGASLSIGTGATTSAVANFASGALDLYSGATTENGNFANAVSGNVGMHSGNTDKVGAGAGAASASGTAFVYSGTTDNQGTGAGANTGNVGVYSGAALSTGTVLSGSSGTASMYSGASADVDSGNVSVYSGNAGLNSGNVLLTTGTAGGTRGYIQLDGNAINLRPAINVNVLDDIPMTFGTGGDINETYVSGTNTYTLAGVAIVAGGAGAATAALDIYSGNREKNDNNAGVPLTGPVSLHSGTSLMSTALAIGGASGAASVYSGSTNVTFIGATGGASGRALLYSGDTDISAAVAATGGNTGQARVYSGAAISTGAGATSGSSGNVLVYSGASEDVNSGDVQIDSGNAGANSGNIVATTGTAGGTRGYVQLDGQTIRLRPVVSVNVLDDIPIYAGTTPMVEMRYELGATTWHVDGVDPAADTVSVHGIMETGATSSTTGTRASGNLTLRSGTTTSSFAGVGGGSGAWIGGSGTTVVSVAQTGGASGPVSLASGATTVSFAGGTGGPTGGWTGGSGQALTSVDAASSGASGFVTLSSGTTLTRVGGTSPVSGDVIVESGITTSNNAGATAGKSGDVTVRSGASVSTLGTSGATGDVALRSGDSDDANSGSIILAPGTAGATRGTVQSTAELTTTDGVAAGAKRRVGGASYRSDVGGANLTSAGGADPETVLNLGTYTIPANTIKLGTHIRVHAIVRVSDGGGAATALVQMRLGGLGGQLLGATTAVDVVTGNICIFDCHISGQAVPGAAASVVFSTKIDDWVAGAGGTPNGRAYGDGFAAATNGALDLVVTGRWNGGGAGDDMNLEQLFVEVIG